MRDIRDTKHSYPPDGGYDVLLGEEDINKRIKELAEEIEKDYRDKVPTFICILKGAFIFCADIIRKIHLPLNIEFVKISTYKGKFKNKTPEVIDNVDVRNKDIIILDEIVDSGETAKYLSDLFLSREAKSVKICALLIKKRKRKIDISPDYIGFQIPDIFVAGYGLDYNEKYRELPFIIKIK